MVFSVTPAVFLGGSFGDEVGHNPYEPAQLGIAIISGPNPRNLEDAFTSLVESGAAIKVASPPDLGEVVARLTTPEGAAAMGGAARVFMERGDNRVARSVTLISDVLQK